MGIITEIKGFSILPLRIYSTVHKREILHYIFFKKHEVKVKNGSNSTKDNNDRSLFVINFPKDITLKKVRNIITNQISDNSAIVEDIIVNNELENHDINLDKLTDEFNDIDNKEYNYKEEQGQVFKLPRNCCIIRFIDKSALNLFLKNYRKLIKMYENNQDSNSLPLYPTSEDEENNEFYGYKRYVNKLREQILNTEELLVTVNISMNKFNNKQTRELEEMNKEENLIDEDGFQLVVSKSHRRTKKTIMGKVS
ncbi:Rrp7p ASCRUDRAFT_77497, partial [Ascoidea rubescens DSM 1968]